jgi:hypothetical protein
VNEEERIRKFLRWAIEGVAPLEDDPMAVIEKLAGRRRRRLRAATSGSLVMAVTLALLVPFALRHPAAAQRAKPTTPTTTLRTTTTTLGKKPGPPQLSLPPLMVRDLWNASQDAAQSFGDADATIRFAVGPVRLDHAEAVLGDGSQGYNPLSYVIEMQGTFNCNDCPGPAVNLNSGSHVGISRVGELRLHSGQRGEQPGEPQLTVVTLYVVAASLAVPGYSFGGGWRSLDALGKPFALPRPPDGATQWSVAPNFYHFLGAWLAGGARLEVHNPPAESTLTWGNNFVDFKLAALVSSYNGTRKVNGVTYLFSGDTAVGQITRDDVGLRVGSFIRFAAAVGAGHFVVVTTQDHPSEPLPPPLCNPSQVGCRT